MHRRDARARGRPAAVHRTATPAHPHGRDVVGPERWTADVEPKRGGRLACAPRIPPPVPRPPKALHCCNAAILTAGRGRRRPPRHCDACRLAIVETADAQAERARLGLFSALGTRCRVCGAPH